MGMIGREAATWRDAAYIVAFERLSEAHKARGLGPEGGVVALSLFSSHWRYESSTQSGETGSACRAH